MDKEQIKEYGNGHFHGGYYLSPNKSWRSCLSEILCDDCYIISNYENMADCPYDDAYTFLHGSCDLFACALHKQFGYEICEIENKNNKAIHWFCQSKYNGNTIYIDVRGATTDFGEFISEFEGLISENDSMTCKNIEDADLHNEWVITGFLFAYAVINEHPEYYKF
jgi:hypothetical protein